VNKSPAFQMYPNDWLSSPKIALMSPAVEGAYIRLLCYDWANDGIPQDQDELAALSRLGEGWLKGGSKMVEACFKQHPTKEGFLTNDRLQKEREKQRIWSQKSKEGGLKSAEKRKKSLLDKVNSRVVKGSLKGGCEMVQPNGNSSSSSSFSSSNVLSKDNTSKTAIEIYNLYPKKVGKEAALKAIVKALSKVDSSELIGAVAEFANAKRGSDPQYIPNPATWFNQSRWEDDRSTWIDHKNKQQNRGASYTDFYDEGLTLKDA